jgi:glycosyltransferase involved in cell wall biosynthesis
MENTFSVVLPVYQGGKTIARAIGSLINQSYPYWELVIINDGSTDDTQEIVSQAMRHDKRIRMFIMPENSGRLIARNMGNRLSRNEWMCMLDTDDEYMTNYLEVLNDEINRNPDYKIFNFGALLKNREMIDGERYEKGWRLLEPLNLKEEGNGMESFPSGKMTTGCFIYKKELLGGVSFYPEARTPYGGDDSYPALLVKKDPRFAQICKQNKEGNWLPMGNPWGDDYTFFWWLTRDNKSKCLDVILHIQHIRP